MSKNPNDYEDLADVTREDSKEPEVTPEKDSKEAKPEVTPVGEPKKPEVTPKKAPEGPVFTPQKKDKNTKKSGFKRSPTADAYKAKRAKQVQDERAQQRDKAFQERRDYGPEKHQKTAAPEVPEPPEEEMGDSEDPKAKNPEAAANPGEKGKAAKSPQVPASSSNNNRQEILARMTKGMAGHPTTPKDSNRGPKPATSNNAGGASSSKNVPTASYGRSTPITPEDGEEYLDEISTKIQSLNLKPDSKKEVNDKLLSLKLQIHSGIILGKTRTFFDKLFAETLE